MVNKSEMIDVVRYLIQCGANIFIDSTEVRSLSCHSPSSLLPPLLSSQPKVAIKILGWVADFPIYNLKDSSHESPCQSRMPFAMITLVSLSSLLSLTPLLSSHLISFS
jgi:hypothetical protein